MSGLLQKKRVEDDEPQGLPGFRCLTSEIHDVLIGAFWKSTLDPAVTRGTKYALASDDPNGAFAMSARLGAIFARPVRTHRDWDDTTLAKEWLRGPLREQGRVICTYVSHTNPWQSVYGTPLAEHKRFFEAPSPIEEAITASRSILQLPHGWDDAEAKPILTETWERAAQYLRGLESMLRLHFGRDLPIPHIGPVPNGSIDLDWDSPRFALLINVPEDPKAPAQFYGDDRGSLSVKGTVDLSHSRFPLMLWLSEAYGQVGR